LEYFLVIGKLEVPEEFVGL